MEQELDWEQPFYVIRMRAEGLMLAEDEKKPQDVLSGTQGELTAGKRKL